MGMPITIDIVDNVPINFVDNIFNYFVGIDRRFSMYKPDSEISRVNAGLPKDKWSEDMVLVLDLCDQTRKTTNGYFNIEHSGQLDPSGLVKGWAVSNAAKQLLNKGIKNFYIEAGGDIQAHGTSTDSKPWSVGIRNPFNISEIVKVIELCDGGVATSGTYIRGQHIYNPFSSSEIEGVKSLTVIAPDIYEADVYATAAFAMGTEGIAFIDSIKGLEGYMVGSDKTATYTRDFERFVATNV